MNDPLNEELGLLCHVPGAAFCGNPINVATGNKFEAISDYQTAGQNKLSFTRYYNSLSPLSAVSALDVVPAGYSVWSSTFNRSIKSLSPTVVAVHRGDGQIIGFTLSGGNWVCDSDIDIQLS